MDTMDAYLRAQQAFDAVLTRVPPDRWDAQSACEGWTVRDVVGHVVWGQELVRHLALGQEYTSRVDAPGATSPGRLTPEDPLVTWRAARDAATAVLTEAALHRSLPERFAALSPNATLVDFLRVLVTDASAHAWDVGHPLGIESRLAPELTPPPGADEQTRWLALLGRAA